MSSAAASSGQLIIHAAIWHSHRALLTVLCGLKLLPESTEQGFVLGGNSSSDSDSSSDSTVAYNTQHKEAD